MTRPDIVMSIHQVARLCEDPREIYDRAIRHIGKYMAYTKEKGIEYKIDTQKGLECHVDADFAGGWNKADSQSSENLLSRTGYIISFSGGFFLLLT